MQNFVFRRFLFNSSHLLLVFPTQTQGGFAHRVGKKPLLNKQVSHVNPSLSFELSLLSSFFSVFLRFQHHCISVIHIHVVI